jgi:hypothetical protein
MYYLLGRSVSELAILLTSLIENMPSVGWYALHILRILVLHFVKIGRVQVGYFCADNAKVWVM